VHAGPGKVGVRRAVSRLRSGRLAPARGGAERSEVDRERGRGHRVDRCPMARRRRTHRVGQFDDRQYPEAGFYAELAHETTAPRGTVPVSKGPMSHHERSGSGRSAPGHTGRKLFLCSRTYMVCICTTRALATAHPEPTGASPSEPTRSTQTDGPRASSDLQSTPQDDGHRE
jgi:hypothetical protein